jgi:hypothetical protein
MHSTICQKAEVRRQNLAAAFQQAELDDSQGKRAYGIDFYGHAKGEILVAIDLCTREALLWFLPNRRQENIARALLTGLIFQKGVPLIFRNDEAAELVAGTVAAMNTYLGIQQVTTGGHNPRSNAVVDRALHSAPNGLLDKVRRQPIWQHARLPSRNCVCPQHRVQLGHQLHTFRGWTRAPSSHHHGSTRKPQAANNGRRGAWT